MLKLANALLLESLNLPECLDMLLQLLSEVTLVSIPVCFY